MPLDTTQLDEDLQHIIADLPITVTYNAVMYTGSKTALRQRDVMANEGMRGLYRFSVHLRAVDLPATPEVGETIAIAGLTYRILEVDTSPGSRSIRLDVGEEWAK